MSSRPAFRAQREIMVRSVLLHGLRVPPAPDLSTNTPKQALSWRRWILEIAGIPQIAAAVRHASPDLAREIDGLAKGPKDVHEPDVEEVRRLTMSLLSYVLRLSYRVTPFGLFAGIAEGRFGSEAEARWGTGHQLLTRADGEWLAAVVQQLEAVPEVRQRLRITASNVLRVRGERLVLPWRPRALDATGTAVHEVTVRRTAAVEDAVRMTAAPLPYREVVDKLAADHPELGVPGCEELLDLLISRRMLLTSLQPSSTDIDALGHVVRELGDPSTMPSSASASLVAALRDIHTQVDSLNHQHPQDPTAPERHRIAVSERMRQIVDRPAPLAVDVKLDAAMTVPRAVAWEVEAAASVLARVTPEPHGALAWTRYRDRFYSRYGEGALVPLMDLLDPHTGLGLPEDYHGTARAPHPDTVRRDRLLVAVAQRAVAAGQDLVLDENLIEQLAGHRPAAAADAPPHVELTASVYAPSTQALNDGEFTLDVRRVSRGWGHFSGGRFAALLAGQERPSDLLGRLGRRPTTVHGALPVQLAFPALLPQAIHITHTPRLIAPLISLSEYRKADSGVFSPDDLAVIWHQDRLQLVSISRRQVLEAAIPHPLQIECQTPGVARFLDEMQRGQSSRLIGSIGDSAAWDWGAARHLAAKPRVRAGRSLLSPATWRLDHAGLPGPDAGVDDWEKAFAALREQWRLPRHVHLTHWDVRLRLDLQDPSHRALLRTRLERFRSLGQLTLTEAEPADAYGWCGGRPHEIVTCLSSKAPRRPAPPVRGAPLVERDQARLPGASPYVSARLYCQPQDRHALLIDHLPKLVADLPRSIWWISSRDTEEPPHTSLAIRLADPSRAGDAVTTLGAWAAHLLDTGVMNDVVFAPYRPHVGLWGTRRMLKAAEEVWATDSAVVAYQHAHLHTLAPPPVLAAANIVAIVTGLHQDPANGMHWLSAQPKPPATGRLSPALLKQARTIADPDDDWCGLRRTPAGTDLVEGPWSARHTALSEHRAALAGVRHPNVDTVLHALLAAHLRLVREPADGIAWRLARAVALAATRPRSKPLP